jgi:hypothetical protein
MAGKKLKCNFRIFKKRTSIMDLTKLEPQFTHSVQEMELILQGLRKLPMELVAELHARLMLSAKQQVDDHLAAQAPAINPSDITVTSTEQPVA